MKHIMPFIILFSFLFSNQVEVGISSIEKINKNISISDVDAYGRAPDYYEIIFYVSNPNNDIAGFQFTLNPKGIFSINKDNIYEGTATDAGFTIYAGEKNGTILGFSMVGDVIEKSEKNNILFKVKTDINNISNYADYEITASNLVIASKQGETVPSVFIPFGFSEIK